ncbi:MAG: hypothetical protein HY318_01000 [Armatimonadetes bacterium]|nr:hypothetical protein [Armatimonadota bacterium]
MATIRLTPLGISIGVGLAVSLLRSAGAPSGERNLSSSPGKRVVAASVRSGNGAYVREDRERILLGNDLIEFAFDKSRSGALVSANDKRFPALKLCTDHGVLQGEWGVELEGAPSFRSSSTSYLKAEHTPSGGECTLEIHSQGPQATLVQTYSLKRNESYLVCRAEYKNLSPTDVQLKQYRYSLQNVAIGGSVTDNRFLYPPQIFHLMYGKIKDATADYLGRRYIYGSLQQTTKLMLPYAMIYNDTLKECLTIAGMNSRTVVRVGALGGESGSLTSLFDVFKLLRSEQTEALGTVYLAFLKGDWRAGTVAEKRLLMREAGCRPPRTLPRFTRDLVIMADGIPGVDINTFDDLGRALKDYRDAGVTALWIGGKTWFCPYSLKPEGPEGFIPIPQKGYVVPDPTAGGEAGLRRLIGKAHSLGMKLFVWGPTSMAGIALQSDESKTQPDWWVYDKEGKFSNWYPFMAPANPNSPGWRSFFLNNVRRIVKDYGVDGFWLDSSWQDHQLNYRAKDGWYGGPNGAKLSLIDEIVAEAKKVNPECVVMAEGGGIETMSRVDAAYIQAFGIWPTIRPDEVQRFVLAQELNRVPGIRPFGQVCEGLGFYAEMSEEPRQLAENCVDSWIAKTFLVSTLDRVPVYFGLNWGIANLLKEARMKSSAGGAARTGELGAAHIGQEFRDWFDSFRKINKIRAQCPEVREGETLFDCVEVSSASVVHYLRHLGNRDSVILLNADGKPQSVTARIVRPEIMHMGRGKRYRITNLMTGDLLRKADGTDTWSMTDITLKGFSISLRGYEGAVLKIRPAEPKARG